MKKLVILCMTVLSAGCATASDRRPIGEVDINAFTKETQVTPANASGDHVALVWWIPNEYWEVVLSRDASTSEEDKKALLDSIIRGGFHGDGNSVEHGRQEENARDHRTHSQFIQKPGSRILEEP